MALANLALANLALANLALANSALANLALANLALANLALANLALAAQNHLRHLSFCVCIAWSGAVALERAQALTKARVRDAPGCSIIYQPFAPGCSALVV